MYDVIDKITLKPGDVVGVRTETQIGWGFFRYQKTIPMTIERITPARTKFVMTNGAVFGRYAPFYSISEKTNHETHVAKCAEKICSSLRALDRLQRDGKLFSQNDDFIVKTAERLQWILDEVM